MQCTQQTKKGLRCKNITQNGLCHIHVVKFNIKSFPKSNKIKSKTKKNENKAIDRELARIDRQMERHMADVERARIQVLNDNPRIFNRRQEHIQRQEFVPFFNNVDNAPNANEDFDF